MGVLSFVPFKGIRSEISPKLLPENYAVEAVNTFLDAGSLSSWKGLTEVATLGKSGTIQTLHLLGGSTWLHFNEVAQVALSPIANNDLFYSVITGFGAPKYTDSGLAIAGGGNTWPNLSYELGFPQPSTQLTGVAQSKAPKGLRGQWTIAGTETDTIGNKLTYTYVYTYADSSGREGPPSVPTDLIYASTDDKIVLSGFSQLTGNYPVTGLQIRIYRSENGGPFQYLAQKTNDTLDFTDDFSIVSGSEIQTTLYSQPHSGMKGIVTMANGIMAGFVNNDVYLSEPYQPHAWPEDYILHTDYDVTGLVAVGNMLIVTTKKYPYIASMSHPSTATLDKLETTQGNLNIRSLVEISGGAVYASDDGLVMVGQSGSSVITKNIISEKTWREMNPSSIHGYFYRGHYFGFYNSGKSGDTFITENGETIPSKGGFIVDIEGSQVVYTDIYADCAYSDLGSSHLFIVQNIGGANKVFQWNSNASKLNFKYKSKPIIVKRTTLNAGRVELKSGSVDLSVIADGNIIFKKKISDTNVFRMPSGYSARQFEIELSGTGEVDGVFLASSVSEIP